MLALGAAAGCRRSDDPAYSRGNTLVMAYPEKLSLRYDDLAIQSLYLPRLAAEDQNGDLFVLAATRDAVSGAWVAVELAGVVSRTGRVR
jgi:hypothetical protein